MEELLKKYPQFKTQLKQTYNFQQTVRTFKKIVPNNKKPTDIKHAVYLQFNHFVNVIQLRYISQLDYFISGLESGNPESFSTLRNNMETMGALAFITNKVNSNIQKGNYNVAQDILYKALMGERKTELSFLSLKEVTEFNKKSYNVMNYIDKADELVTKLFKVDGKEKVYFKPQYEILCERTHPNYQALSMFYYVIDGELSYNSPPNILIEEDFGLLIHAIMPLLPIYVYFLKKALELIQELTS